MATEGGSEQETRRTPKLEEVLLKLRDVTTQLTASSVSYKSLQSLRQGVPADSLANFKLGLLAPDGSPVAVVPMPRVPMSLIEDVMSALGGQILDLWAEAHTITTEASQYCAAAAAAARPQA